METSEQAKSEENVQETEEQTSGQASQTTEAEGAGGQQGQQETQADKERNRQGFEQRQAEKRLKALEEELNGYKRREEDARKAKLTEEERLKEEREQLARENEQLKREKLESQVRAKYGIPDAIPLVGSDLDALDAHAQEVAKFLPKPKVGSATNPVKETGGPQTFKRSQLRDPEFYKANEAAIKQAYKEGRITND